MSDALPLDLSQRYRARRVLGRGAFGTVIEAHDVELDRPVALKLLRPSAAGDEAATRFLREAVATARLDHPGVVRVFDHGICQDGQRFIVYQLVEGEDLAQRSGPPPASAEVRRWGATLARALAAAHELGVLHRDVKPANVMLDRQGQVRLCDFGLARDRGGPGTATATGVLLGTPSYTAPELIHGRPHSPASDQFALAATLFEIATGSPPFGAARMRRLLDGEDGGTPEPCPELEAQDPGLVSILQRAMAPEPEARWPSMGDFAEALDPGASGGRRSASTSTGAARRAPHQGPLRVRGALLVGAGLLLTAGWWARRPGEPATPPPSPRASEATRSSRVTDALERVTRVHRPARGRRLEHVYATRDELLDPRLTLAIQRLAVTLGEDLAITPSPVLVQVGAVLGHIHGDYFDLVDTAHGLQLDQLEDHGRELMVRAPEVRARHEDLLRALRELGDAVGPRVQGGQARPEAVLLWAYGAPYRDEGTLRSAAERILEALARGPDPATAIPLCSLLDYVVWSREGDPRLPPADLRAIVEKELALTQEPRLAEDSDLVIRLLLLATTHATPGASRGPRPPSQDALEQVDRCREALAAYYPSLPPLRRPSVLSGVKDLAEQRQVTRYPLHLELTRRFEALDALARDLRARE